MAWGQPPRCTWLSAGTTWCPATWGPTSPSTGSARPPEPPAPGRPPYVVMSLGQLQVEQPRAAAGEGVRDTVPRGGLHLWLTLPTACDDIELSDRARARRLLIGAGRPYYVSEPPGPRLRLSFAAATSTQLTAGVRLLEQVLREAVP